MPDAHGAPAVPEEAALGSGGRLPALKALVAEFGKFGAVGAVAYAVDVGLFNVGILALHMPDIAAKTGSMLVAEAVAFAGNRFWTWRDRPRSGLRREYLLFFLFNAVGLGIALACLGVNHLLALRWPEVFATPLAANIAANIVGVGLGSVFRFHAYRTWVFRKPPM